MKLTLVLCSGPAGLPGLWQLAAALHYAVGAVAAAAAAGAAGQKQHACCAQLQQSW